MPAPVEGYVFHSYGPVRYVRHVVASVVTLRRHDPDRPIALFCPPHHQAEIERYGLDTLFHYVGDLPEEHQSIVGFKHHLHRFMPFDRNLFIDADMVWCRNPDPLWRRLSSYPFTATGIERADFYFGGPKGFGVLIDYLLDHRRRTMRRFNLTHLPRIQAGMIYAQDHALAREVCEHARRFLDRRAETHFRSRLNEGRNEESCEWSLAMAMSALRLQVLPWLDGFESPQFDYIDGMTRCDRDFETVYCRYFTDPFVNGLRGIMMPRLRDFLIRLFTSLPGRGDYQDITPYAMHFGWLKYKRPFFDFSEMTWARVTRHVESEELLEI